MTRVWSGLVVEENNIEVHVSALRKALDPHLVTNAGDTSAVFLVLQGIGEHDFVALA